MVEDKKDVAVVVVTNFRSLFLVLLSCLVSSSIWCQTKKDSAKSKKTDIAVLMGLYTQDGKHSAITGGTGTEKLEVYRFNAHVKHQADSLNTYRFSAAVDYISSASSDKIDFEKSSASSKDLHNALTFGYSRNFKKKPLTIGGGLAFSLESDYFSRGAQVWANYLFPKKTKELSGGVQVYWDDLRWGRLKKPYITEAQHLIYPEELRDSNWFDVYERYSYNFFASYRADINKRMRITFFPSYTYQHGLLSTPFHRVYFTNSLRPVVENLPRKKHQTALGVQLNYFLKSKTVLKGFYQFYTDNFGIQSHQWQLEIAYKINAKISVAPKWRISTQTASTYFKPYASHITQQLYYTSDYDLSDFWTSNLGLAFRVNRSTHAKKRMQLPGFTLRYSYYYRSDGLQAHILTSFWQLQAKRKTKKPLN
mgnify:CR=1 FL=1